ncbi:P-loop containing nucleoside triphosphate hydrolase protein [Fistulina hepatica ATCC 64428]|uniref:RNA helicase n=1 Tax=Fistulina hepatica ATCC 64428 TaxID=1128425 RepID=A0A0D7A323_9AGAR|nr:P-loop containing nucleoside triphosphate hydrolase protein [Fistulina hepatica ATCC 64428]
MEAFRLLSCGGVKFDKSRFQKDVALFQKPSDKQAKKSTPGETDSLPAELDYFKYAQGGPVKRKAETTTGPTKKRKLSLVDSDDDSDNEKASYSQSDPLPQQKHRVTAKGFDIPQPIETFEQLTTRYHLSPRISANLSENGFLHPTGIQSHAIPILLESRDLAAISPTGTGKTLSYVLPILCALNQPVASVTGFAGGVRAVVLAPTRELAHQIHNEFLKLAQGRKWRIILFTKATAATLTDKEARDRVDIIISTPLRLVASLQSGDLDMKSVRHLVLDEADRMLDPEFLQQIEEIVTACTHPDIQKAVFSATLPAGAEKTAMDMLRNPIRIVVGLKDTPLPLIAQTLTYVADDQSKLPSLLGYLAQPYNPPVLIFTSTQPRASSLAEELVLNGIANVGCLHAGMSKKERDDAVGRMRRGETWIMVSTEVMARGMDFKGDRHDDYAIVPLLMLTICAIGRTGRAGREGKAVTYYTDEDGPYLKPIANVLLQSGSTVPDWITKLPKPSKMKRRQMGKVKRSEHVNSARSVGRNDAVKKREMIAASKRRKLKALQVTDEDDTAATV